MNELRVKLAHDTALQRHAGQVDKSGKPYFGHIQFVVDHVSGDDEKIVAYLHDIVEDTGMPLSEIETAFGADVAAAVDAMTHREGVEYMDYIRRLAKNPLARAVKIADLTHNMMIERIPDPKKEDFARLRKYRQAYEYLTKQSE